MARTSSRAVAHVVIVGLVLAAAVLSACTANTASALVGTWTTSLTGYHTTAKSITSYEQTVTFSDDGKVVLRTTLPGGDEASKGSYTVLLTNQGQTVHIVWDQASDTPLELGVKIEGDKLITTRRQGTMPTPPNMNVTKVDPIVYTRR